MNKEKYCKFCGRELELGKCICDEFENSKNNKTHAKKIFCDTCGKSIDADSIYCAYCGIPVVVNGKIRELQLELSGENAPDVIKIYSNKSNAKNKSKSNTIFTIVIVSIVMFCVGLFIGLIAKPIFDKFISDYSIRKNIISDVDINETMEIIETTTTKNNEDETTIIRDEKEKNVDETDNVDNEKSEESKKETSDEKNLDDNSEEDDNLEEDDSEKVNVKRDNTVYFDAPSTSSNIRNSNQKSAITGEIVGVDPDKKYSIYIKNLKMIKDSVKNGEKSCNITYYIPYFDGADNEEVNKVNEIFDSLFRKDYNERIKEFALGETELPDSIIFNKVEQRNVNKSKVTIIIYGNAKSKKSLQKKLKYRIIYDRKQETITHFDDIPE